MILQKTASDKSKQANLLNFIEDVEMDNLLKEYRDTFARDPTGPYAIQWPGRVWKTKYKGVSDPLLKAHLNEIYWVAVKASWYPPFAFLDFDAPAIGLIERAVERLHMGRGHYLLMTSPSYFDDKSCHLVLQAEYKGKRATQRLIREALSNMVGSMCEVYPQLRRKFRLPLGRGQRLIGKNGEVLDTMPWWEAMYWMEKIDPLPIENMTFQLELPFASPVKSEDKPRNWAKSGQAKELYEHGLQAPGTRHESQWIIAVSLWRSNWLPEDAIATIKKWIRKQHNGMSKTATAGRWRVIDEEICRQVQWIWTHFRPYPDTPHNLEGYVTKEDLRFIADVYPCDVVNQKRLFALVCYMRPRAHHDYVYVPYHVWQEQVANDRTYHAFRQDLEAKGLLESVMSYRHVENVPEASYSRKFRLKLPSSDKQPIQYEGRNEHDYYQALQLVLGPSVRTIVDFTGVSKERIYEAIRNQTP